MNRDKAMESASTPSEKSGSLPKSHFQPTVCLADWWLIKVQNELAVAGCSPRGKQGMRVFSSAPILRRHDVLTLETSDGICVILNASMNRARTIESGFPSEVCDHFIYGFPPYWKVYYEKFMCNESSTKNMMRFSSLKKQSPQSKEKDGLLYRHNHKNVLDVQDGLNAEDLLKGEKDKPIAAPSPRTSGSVLSKDTYISSISFGVHEQGSYPEVPTSEGQVSLNMLCNIPNHTVNLQAYSNSGVTTDISAVNVEDLDDSQIDDSCGSQFRHELSDSSRGKMERRAGLRKKNAKALSAPSEVIIDKAEGNVQKCAIPTPNGQQKNGKRTSRVSGADVTLSDKKGELTSSDYVSDDMDLGSYEGSGFQKCTVKRKLIKSGDGLEQIIGTPMQNEDTKTTEIDGNKHKGKHKATSPNSAGAAAGKHKQALTADRSSLSTEASGMTTRSMGYLGAEKGSKIERRSRLQKKSEKALSNTAPPEDIIDKKEGKVQECAIPTSKKQKIRSRTARVSGIEMNISDKKGKSALTDYVLDDTNMGNYEGSGFRNCSVKRKLIKPGDGLEQIIGAPIQNEDTRTIKTDGKKLKEKCKATRPHSAGAAAGKRKQAVTADESALSENTEASGMRTRSRRYVTPDTSPSNTLGFTRSKSGRLLVPTLDFWRNQRAIYDLDRTVTGIQDSIPLEKPGKGSQSAPPTKRHKIT